MRADTHPRQYERLSALRDLKILDTPREEKYDQIVDLVADVCAAPIAVINLIDERRQWFKAEIGLGVRETPLETSLCSHIILTPGLTIIEDTLLDARFCDNPLCLDEPRLRFYAGMCLETEDGLPIGTLCVLDRVPRTLTGLQKKFLTVFGHQVMAQMRLSQQLQRAELLQQEVDHRVKNSLASITSVLSLQERLSSNLSVKSELKKARDRIWSVNSVHEQLHASGQTTHLDLAAYLRRMAGSLEATTGRRATIVLDCPEVMISGKDAANVGLIVNELVANAVRHGIGEGTGRVRISGQVRGDRVWIGVMNTGRDLPADFDPEKSQGLGMRLSLTLARSFGGKLHWSSTADGTLFGFDLPIAGT